MISLKEILYQNYPVSDSTIEAIEKLWDIEKVHKGEVVIEQGKYSNSLIFILDGIFRVGYEDDAKQSTLCFGVDGDPFMSLHSFYASLPAQFSFEAITNATIAKLKFEDFKRCLEEYPDLMKWLNSVLIEQIFVFERKYVNLANQSAYDRYLTLMKLRKEIINQIPLKYIAQYLEITPETLSRIRAEYAKKI